VLPDTAHDRPLPQGQARPSGGARDEAWAEAPWRTSLALVFVIVHALGIWAVLGPEAEGATDVNLYAYWMQGPAEGRGWPVIDFDWVYPVVALIPMVLAQGLVVVAHLGYMLAWLLVVTALNAGACAAAVKLLGRRTGSLAGLLWLAFIALQGTTALTRVDSVAAPLILVGVAAAGRHTTLATAVLTVGAWVKVAPGAVVLPLLAAARDRLRHVIAPALVTCAAVIGGALLVGAPLARVLGFFVTQADRGLQVEAVAATPMLVWRCVTGQPIGVFDEALGTWETGGRAADAIGTCLNPLLVVAALGVAWLAYRARHVASRALPIAAVAALACMVVFNKVGSPQFIDWLGPAVAVGWALRLGSVRWRLGGLGLALAAISCHLLYPTLYLPFIDGQPLVVALVVLRNVVVVALAAGATWHLWQLGRRGPSPSSH
jgi:hypothetical protein